MIDRSGVDGFEHASDLRGGAQVHALADLRAGADQSVRVDHRAFVHVGADVDEHGRHADDRRRNVGAFADGRSSGHQANAIGERQSAGREGVLVDKGEHVAVRHFLQFAETEAEQDALLHPGIDDPAVVDFLGGADLAASQCGAEGEKGAAGLVGSWRWLRQLIGVQWLTSEQIGNLTWGNGSIYAAGKQQVLRFAQDDKL